MITLEDLKLHIDNMYDQLDPDVIDQWDADGIEIYVDGKTYVLKVEAAQ